MVYVYWTEDDGTARSGALLAWYPSGFTDALVLPDDSDAAIFVTKGALRLGVR